MNQLIKTIHRILGQKYRTRLLRPAKSRLPTVKRLLFCDVDNTLLGDDGALRELLERLDHVGESIGWGIATGRHLQSTLKVLRERGLPIPDVLITSVGTEIYYGGKRIPDHGWTRHIDYRWERERLLSAMCNIPGVRPQPKDEQRPHKLSYFVDPDKAPPIRKLLRHLRGLDLHANLIYSHNAYLDLVPLRASKGLALRYLGALWGIPPESMLVAGGSGNDIDMLRGDTLAVVVGNHSRELLSLRGEPRIHFAEGHHANGILEGLDHYRFLNPIQQHQESDDDRHIGASAAAAS